MRPVSEIKKQRAGQVSPTQLPPCGDPLWIVWDSVKNDFVATYPTFAEAVSFRGGEHQANAQMPLLRVGSSAKVLDRLTSLPYRDPDEAVNR